MNTSHEQTDRIEKQIEIKAPRSRVWRALTNAAEFGEWFCARLEGEFSEGQTIRGHITYPGYEHLRMEIEVVRIEPESYFAFRWHPYAVDPEKDYSGEPTTLIEFRLIEQPQGTRLELSESGFDALPAERRTEAFFRNSGGWEEQLENIQAYAQRT